MSAVDMPAALPRNSARTAAGDRPAARDQPAATALGPTGMPSPRRSDLPWARPAVAVLGIDCPPVVDCSASAPPTAGARGPTRKRPGAR